MTSSNAPALDSLGLLEGLATTRAIRRYADEPVPPDALRDMLFAATRAPTGSNRQPFRFLVLRDGERSAQAKALLGEAFRAGWAAKRDADGYTAATTTDTTSPKARAAATMQHFVDHVEERQVGRARIGHPSSLAGIA